MPAGSEFWRFDRSAPDAWTWDGFPAPRYRFDPASGAFRVRYGATAPHGAARERYDGTGMVIPNAAADDNLVHLRTRRALKVLDMRGDRTQDQLRVDDQMNTSREPGRFATCQALADAARNWWDDLDGIVYRSRTTPASSTNLAFWSADPFDIDSVRLGDAADLLVDLVLRWRFTVDFDF